MKSKLICIIAAIVIGVFGGCNKFEDDINQNPNLPGIASGTQLIANAALYLPDLSATPTAQFMAQYLAETQYVGTSLYPEGGTSFYGLYQGPLMNLEAVLRADELNVGEGPIENQLAVAKILKAYFIWHITDRWGDVPFSEALQGVDNLTPVYDRQEAIYDGLFALLTEAADQMVEGDISNDIIYDGDISKWRKLGNTVHLLMALRLSEVAPEKAAAEFNRALQRGIMESNADNLKFRHLADANNQNYWYGQIVGQNREWWALTETLVGLMRPTEDPRLPVYGQPAVESGEYVGLTFGTTDPAQLGTTEYSLLGTAVYAQDADIALVTYAQALFALAEGAARGWIPGGDAAAKTYYELAIENSVLQWTGSTEGVIDYLMNPPVAYAPERRLAQIATQRYIHLFMHGYEAWAEWRRTGFPDNLLASGGKPVPRRQAYPANEQFNNKANYQDAIQRQFGGEDNLAGRVWWDIP